MRIEKNSVHLVHQSGAPVLSGDYYKFLLYNNSGNIYALLANIYCN
ncbi:hypothetical protein [Winogradskyella costae]|nr:hypothetical protein [Winogradskyella costae]